MKKIIYAILTACIALSLTSCDMLLELVGTSEPEHVHEWTSATCLGPKTCECGAVDGEPLGHAMTDPTCTEAPVCTNEGCEYTEGESLGHDMTAPSCLAPASCRREGCDHADTELGHHELVLAVNDGEISYSCTVCSKTLVLENGFYLDGTDHEGITGIDNRNNYTTVPDTHLPIINENGEYQLTNTTNTRGQLQLWIPHNQPLMSGFSAQTNSIGVLSFRINSKMNYGLNMKFVDTSSTGKRWSDDWCINNPFFSLSELYMHEGNVTLGVRGLSDALMAQITVNQDTWFSGWIDVKIGIVLSPVADAITLHYYVNGDFVGSKATRLTTLTDSINSIYISGYTLEKDSGIYIDDIVFGYTTDGEWIFDKTSVTVSK